MCAKLHNDKGRKQCVYFKHNITCPFDKLGCKFLHVSFDISKIEHTSQVGNLDHTKNDIFANSIDGTDDIADTGSFLISTPKKFEEKCTKCFNKTKYCVVCEVLEREESSSITFCRRINFKEELKKG